MGKGIERRQRPAGRQESREGRKEGIAKVTKGRKESKEGSTEFEGRMESKEGRKEGMKATAIYCNGGDTLMTAIVGNSGDA